MLGGRWRGRFGAFVFVGIACSPAFAGQQDCRVRVVKNVGSEEAPDSVLPRGSTEFGPVTQVRVNKKTGRMVFCAHGSYCYSSSAFTFTSPCRLSASSFEDVDDFFYDAE